MNHHYEIAEQGFHPVFKPLEFWQCKPLFDGYPPKHVAREYGEWALTVSHNLTMLVEFTNKQDREWMTVASRMQEYGSSMLRVVEDVTTPLYHKRDIREALDKGWFDSVLDNRDYVVKMLKEMPYEQYLQTIHWKYVRLSKIILSGAACAGAYCGKRNRSMWDELKKLHIHHKTYENRGCEEPNDLVQLCDYCHKQEHDPVLKAEAKRISEIRF